jgi:hypothetical protein
MIIFALVALAILGVLLAARRTSVARRHARADLREQ